MSSTFLLRMITPEQIIYQQPATKLIIDTLEGEITVLPSHTPLVSVIRPGEAKITELQGNLQKERTMAVSEGIIEIRENTVRLLLQSAERVEELEKEKIELAKKKAEELIERAKKMGADKQEFAKLESGLEREIARLKVLEKYRRKRS